MSSVNLNSLLDSKEWDMTQPPMPEGTLVTVFLHGMIARPPPDIERMDPDELRRYCRDLMQRNDTLQEYLEGALEVADTMAARVRELEAKIGQVAK